MPMKPNTKLQATISESWPYRKSQSHWAGGKHTVIVSVGTPAFTRCESHFAWSHNGKWRGTNSIATICVSPAAARLDNLFIGGLLTIDARKIGPREYRAKWVEQGRGVSLNVTNGYIIRGYHVVADSATEARAKAAKARARMLISALSQRAKRQAHRRDVEQYKNVWVTREDSIAAGNCDAGTRQATSELRRKLGGEIAAVRADYLLSYRDDAYTRRAVERAANRAATQSQQLHGD